MRIDPTAVVSQIAPTARTTRGTTESAPLKSEQSAVVELSSAGAAASVDRPSASVTARLDKIRALIDAGQYPVDLDKLASRIVDDDSVRGGGGRS